VHNALDEQTGGWLVEPLDEFCVATQFPSALPSKECILHSVGVRPNARERDAVVRLLRKCVKHRSSTPTTIGKALIDSMSWLSRRHTRIGNRLLLVSLPKSSAEEFDRTGNTSLLAAPTNDATATFTYASPEGSLTWYGPHIVREGVVLTEVAGGPL